ncbi:MAG TPA: IS21 family transposase [Acetobacteraceae bacterium]|nr:IS21 family transposase [Acetobacteraceae bacterium]
MPAERLSMRKVREVLRLRHACGASVRTIARAVGVGHTTVAEYLRRTTVIGITWPVPPALDDAALERRLFAPPGFNTPQSKPMPDWHHVHAELRRRGVTLLLLWEEYRAAHPDGYGYSRFCDLYIDWRRGISATMRQTHVAGEKLFVDFAGDTVPVFDGLSGEARRAHVFVAVLGASNYTYAEARWSEGLADWVGAHVSALSFLGGVPRLLVCDNLRAGVTAACRYEPGINRTYQELATHYGTAVLPTRVRRPRDKAKVETAVLIVERYILARLRNRHFLSLGDLNAAIRELLGELNARLMRKLGASRREFFESLDRPALLPLPPEPYAYAEWRRCRVAPDDHVEVQGHFYSVPSRLIREVVEARITAGTVELFHAGQRVAAHPRSALKHRHTTILEHMPSAHRRYASWTPARIQSAAAAIGPGTAALVEAILRGKPHPEQGFRACLGILRLARTYGDARLEAACQRGLSIGARSYGSIASILRTGLDRAFHDAADVPAEAAPLLHANIRGRGYYH